MTTVTRDDGSAWFHDLPDGSRLVITPEHLHHAVRRHLQDLAPDANENTSEVWLDLLEDLLDVTAVVAVAKQGTLSWGGPDDQNPPADACIIDLRLHRKPGARIGMARVRAKGWRSADLALLYARSAGPGTMSIVSVYPADPPLRCFIAGARPLAKANAHLHGRFDPSSHLRWPVPVMPATVARLAAPQELDCRQALGV